MITEKDLQEAIAECHAVKDPNANTCIKLAAYYTILDHMDDKESYSYAAGPSDVVVIDTGSAFAKLIDGRRQSEIWPLIEELLEAVQVINPRLYDGFMSRLE